LKKKVVGSVEKKSLKPPASNTSTKKPLLAIVKSQMKASVNGSAKGTPLAKSKKELGPSSASKKKVLKKSATVVNPGLPKREL